MTIGTPLINNVMLFKELPYDPDKDFVVISTIAAQGVPLIVSDKVPATNLTEFIAYAKKAGKVSLGTYGVNSAAHLAIMELNKQYGLQIEPVHYRGEAPMWADLLSQAIDGGLGSYVAAIPVIQAGKGKVIAASGRPIRKLPEVQTFSQQGATSKFFGIDVYSGILAAPAGTPDPIIKKLSELMVAASKDEKTQAALSSFTIELPTGLEEAQRGLQTRCGGDAGISGDVEPAERVGTASAAKCDILSFAAPAYKARRERVPSKENNKMSSNISRRTLLGAGLAASALPLVGQRRIGPERRMADQAGQGRRALCGRRPDRPDRPHLF